MASADLQRTELLLGKYQIVEPLRQGGTAAIYLAVMKGENGFSREVVVKKPLPHLLADRHLRSMFIDEAHIASRLAHPNIVQVIDLVAREDDVFLVLEYLRGVDLREVLRRTAELGQRVPEDLAAYIGAEVAAGLDFAHDATTPDNQPLNLVHRDVSPKNIRITDRGAVKVIDFGIARAENRLVETAPGSVKGTLGYMAPEQVMGDEIDRRTDMFCFGICLYQMLTSRNPFDASSVKERVQRLLQAPIPPVRELNPAVHPRLEAVVMRCLDRDIEARYPRMSDVQRELEAHLAEQQVASPRQRLVAYLERLFPDIHQLPQKLQEVLSTLSGLTNRGSEIAEAARVYGAEIDPRPIVGEHTGEGAMASASSVSQPAMTAGVSGISGGGWSSWSSPPVAQESSTQPSLREANDTRPMLSGRTPGREDALGQALTEPAMQSQSPPRPTSARTWLFIGAGLLGFLFLGIAYGIHAARRTEVLTVPIASPESPRPSQAPALAPAHTSTAVAIASPAPLASAQPTPSPSPAATSAPIASASPASTPPPHAASSKDRASPRELLKAGAALLARGEADDAITALRLAYARSGNKPDPAIFRSLGAAHRSAQDADKVRACFQMYLLKKPDAEEATKIRALLAGLPPAKPTVCVTEAEAAEAEKIARRIGARVEEWVELGRHR
ncbi:MAG: protein kinase [Myxococcota bacterium]